MSQYKCTEDQLRKLRLFFKINPSPAPAKREALAEELQLTFKYVDYWFRRERKKHRRRNIDARTWSIRLTPSDSNNNQQSGKKDTLSIEEHQDQEIKKLRKIVSSYQHKIKKMTESHNQTVEHYQKALPHMRLLINTLYWKTA
ncbi:Oidioi.mRNA.OKI2018_I69.chr1.g2331.t1.cds [Oikopleura dioica]|uniref:Oidioi.mRNA.OKI2018_I69.chr1.g2331.t1.cds n=1 Tax=Oikopleura dioica TaxID=34765 RepID=A0ABN7SQS7_OIKDI|nr:Oidioi.mRNA.OKI2018_I69.chr1.g2331.t1.cds [Oikopleura dioica]